MTGGGSWRKGEGEGDDFCVTLTLARGALVLPCSRGGFYTSRQSVDLSSRTHPRPLVVPSDDPRGTRGGAATHEYPRPSRGVAATRPQTIHVPLRGVAATRPRTIPVPLRGVAATRPRTIHATRPRTIHVPLGAALRAGHDCDCGW